MPDPHNLGNAENLQDFHQAKDNMREDVKVREKELTFIPLSLSCACKG